MKELLGAGVFFGVILCGVLLLIGPPNPKARTAPVQSAPCQSCNDTGILICKGTAKDACINGWRQTNLCEPCSVCRAGAEKPSLRICGCRSGIDK